MMRSNQKWQNNSGDLVWILLRFMIFISVSKTFFLSFTLCPTHSLPAFLSSAAPDNISYSGSWCVVCQKWFCSTALFSSSSVWRKPRRCYSAKKCSETILPFVVLFFLVFVLRQQKRKIMAFVSYRAKWFILCRSYFECCRNIEISSFLLRRLNPRK